MRSPRLLREVALTSAALVGALVLVGTVLVAALDLHLLVFRSGSMAPAIDTGSVAVAREVPAREVRVGDVVSVRTQSGSRVTHRVVDLATSDGTNGDDGAEGLVQLRLQGDANDEPDAETYRAAQVLRVAWSVPWVGRAVVWLSGPTGLLVLGAWAMGMLVLLLRPRPPRGPSDPGPPDAGRRGTRSAGRHRGRAPVAGGLALALALGASPAEAAWTNAAPTTAGLAANAYFTCDAAARLPATPYLYYQLDETSGSSAADSSGNGRTGTYRTSSITGSTGRTLGTAKACPRDTGASATLDGSNGYLVSAATAAPTAANRLFDDLTLSVWFRTTTTTGGRLIGLGSADNGLSLTYDRMLYLSGGATSTRLNFTVYPGAVVTLSSAGGSTLRDGGWHHAVATLSSTAGMALYVDGVQVAADPSTRRGQYYLASTYWRIGFDSHLLVPMAPVSNYFAGSLDEVAVFTTALSSTTVTAMYRAGRPA